MMARPPTTPMTIPAMVPPEGPDEVPDSAEPAPGVCMIPPVMLVRVDAEPSSPAAPSPARHEVSSRSMTVKRLLREVVRSGSSSVAMT